MMFPKSGFDSLHDLGERAIISHTRRRRMFKGGADMRKTSDRELAL
jgi:hypothetical protein